MKKLFDLRFVIGAFFFIIGILLFTYSLIANSESQSVNKICGGIFLLFGIVMILLSYRKNAADE